jgi:hypothetical protein
MEPNKQRARRRKRNSSAPDPFRVAREADAPASRQSSIPAPPSNTAATARGSQPPSSRRARGQRSSVPSPAPSAAAVVKPYVPGAPLAIVKPTTVPPPAAAEMPTPPPVTTSEPPERTATLISAGVEPEKRPRTMLPRIIGIGVGAAIIVGAILWAATRGGSPETAAQPPAMQETAPAEQAAMQAPAPAPSPSQEQAQDPEKTAEAPATTAAPDATAEPDAKGKKKKKKTAAGAKTEAAPKATAKATPTAPPPADTAKPAFTFTFGK